MKSKLILSACVLLIFSCATSPKQQPDWVLDPYAKYNKQANIAVVGSGNSRQTAEKNALGNLVAQFGQSIQVDETVSTLYQEAVKNGISNWAEKTSVNNEIMTSANLDTLIGAEIAEVWYDGSSTYYSVAVMNRAKTILTYTELVRANQEIIDGLTNIPAEQKNTLEGFSRYNLAATIADVNYGYANLLSVIGSPAQLSVQKRGDSYRLEATKIAGAIPVGVRVNNDRANRVQSSFAKTLSEIGFRSGGTNPRYIIDVNISLSPEDFADSQFKFVRMELTANFIDTGNNTILLPYAFTERDGHNTQDSAENRAFLTAERKIEAEYKALLNRYLLQLLP